MPATLGVITACLVSLLLGRAAIAAAGRLRFLDAPGERKLAVWYLKEGRLLAVDTMNDPPSFLIGKKLIAAKSTPDPKILADSAADLKSLLS